MEPVRQKSLLVKGEYVTAGLIGILVLTVFAGGIFLFHNISPTPQPSPSPAAENVLSAVATPQPTVATQQAATDFPAGPQAPTTTAKPSPTKSPTPTPSSTGSSLPSPSSSTSPSPSASSGTDTTPPTITLSSPTNEASVSGQLTVSGSASDDVSLKNVTLYLDNKTFIDSTTSSSYSFTWDSKSVSNGSHTLKTEASDTSGNLKSTSVNINVHN